MGMLQGILISNFRNTLRIGQGDFQEWHIIVAPVAY